MKIYIFRHAQKSFSPSGDPGLTEFGKAQGEILTSWVQKRALPDPQRIYSSPKLRAQQTFQNLADTLEIPLELNINLLERHPGESQIVFSRRVQDFLLLFSPNKPPAATALNSKECIFICSHHDWIAEALSLINCNTDLNSGKYISWPPCQFIGFELGSQDSIWKIIDFKQIAPESHSNY